ncbi:unnamed protein product, partial [Lymnaea stagnalis]
LIEIVNGVFLGSVIAIFGIVANSINIAVFYRQGLNTTINISFTMLAVSDLCSLVTYLMFNVCTNPLVVNSGAPVVFSEVKHLTSAFPHACFSRVTAWITAYITAERCACIAYPLKVKRMITLRRACVILVAIYAVMILSLTPEYATVYVTWKFYPQLNRTLLGTSISEDRNKVKKITFLLYPSYTLSAFIAVALFTSILLVALNRKAKWRQVATTGQSEIIATRDKKTVKMVIVLAGIFAVTVSPAVLVTALMLSIPGLDFVGEYSNLFFVFFSFTFLFDVINSSAHIFLYYKMSSNYRDSFHEIL